MKHLNSMIAVSCLGLMLAGSYGCATIVKGSAGDVYLRNAPKDIQVYEGETPLNLNFIEDTQSYGFGDSFKDEMNNTSTTYYAYAVTLNPSSEAHTLTLKSGGKTATVELKPRMKSLWLVLNLFLTGPVGIIVDASNGNWDELAPEGGDMKEIDVSKYL